MASFLRNRSNRRTSIIKMFAAAAVVAITTATAASDKPFFMQLPLRLPTAQKATADQPAQAQQEQDPVKQADQPAEPIRVNKPGTFEIHVQGADLRGVLQLLSTQGRKNIVATKEVTGSVTADLYGVTFKEALEAVVHAAGFVYLEKDNFIYVYTPKQLEDIIKSQRRMITRVFRLGYIPAVDASPMVEKALSPDGAIAITPAATTGVGASEAVTGGDSYALNDVLVVTDYEDVIEKVAKIIEEIDIKPDQVLIEVTMLSASLDDTNALGVNFSTLAGVDFETLNSPSTSLGNMGAAGLSGTNLQNAPASTWRTDFTTVSSGMTLGFVSNNVGMFLTALESVSDTTILANPKLLVVNKQRGEVLVGARDGYIVTTVTEGQTTQSVQFLETGTKLIIRPFVAKDGFIRMEIHPEDSKGSVIVTEGLALPSETTTELTTNVMVRDGHTIVMGGLFREELLSGKSQVPLLGNIPYIGTLFGYVKDQTKRKEIIILMTPHIIRHAPDEAVSAQVRDDIERFRAGHRNGLRWWGREKLAHTHLRWAKQALTQGRVDRALWNVDMALAFQPRLADAITMKERLTEQAIWADTPAESSIARIIEGMIMQDLGLPTSTILPPDRPRDPGMIDPKVRSRFGYEGLIEQPLPVKQLNLTPQVNQEPVIADSVTAEELSAYPQQAEEKSEVIAPQADEAVTIEPAEQIDEAEAKPEAKAETEAVVVETEVKAKAVDAKAETVEVKTEAVEAKAKDVDADDADETGIEVETEINAETPDMPIFENAAETNNEGETAEDMQESQ